MIRVLILAIILLAKAVFSAADTAFTYVSKAKISQESKKNERAKRLKKILEDKSRLFDIIEVGIVMAELFATAFVAEFYLEELADFLMGMNIKADIAMLLSVLIITVILSYILLIFGGILPKKIARNNPEKTAYTLMGIFKIFVILNIPFEKIIRVSIKVFCRIFGIQDKPEDRLTEREIKMIIAEGKDQGIVDSIEKEIAFNALKFNNIPVKKAMVPKEEIKFINVKETPEKILETIRKYKFTRMPVFENTRDNVIGLLNIKDLVLAENNKKLSSINIKSIVRPILIVEKEQKISAIFKIMQANQQAMSIVKDRDAKVVGLVTMEDILEKLVGKIFDEYDIVKKK